jgi:hypothetical protein
VVAIVGLRGVGELAYLETVLNFLSVAFVPTMVFVVAVGLQRGVRTIRMTLAGIDPAKGHLLPGSKRRWDDWIFGHQLLVTSLGFIYTAGLYALRVSDSHSSSFLCKAWFLQGLVGAIFILIAISIFIAVMFPPSGPCDEPPAVPSAAWKNQARAVNFLGAFAFTVTLVLLTSMEGLLG